MPRQELRGAALLDDDTEARTGTGGPTDLPQLDAAATATRALLHGQEPTNDGQPARPPPRAGQLHRSRATSSASSTQPDLRSRSAPAGRPVQRCLHRPSVACQCAVVAGQDDHECAADERAVQDDRQHLADARERRADERERRQDLRDVRQDERDVRSQTTRAAQLAGLRDGAASSRLAMDLSREVLQHAHEELDRSSERLDRQSERAARLDARAVWEQARVDREIAEG